MIEYLRAGREKVLQYDHVESVIKLPRKIKSLYLNIIKEWLLI